MKVKHTTILRWEMKHCWTEIRLHEDGHMTSHYQTHDGMNYSNQIDASEQTLLFIAARCFGVDVNPNRIKRLTRAMWEGAKRLETSFDKRRFGIYIGPETQFKGRSANLVVYVGHVMAQFDTGKLWETHSRLNFPIEHWEIEHLQIDDDSTSDIDIGPEIRFIGPIEHREIDGYDSTGDIPTDGIATNSN